MTLEVSFWGTRGSVPSPGPETVRHGGNTPCLEVRSSAGDLAILDAGTGIRGLGNEMAAAAGDALETVDIFLTHAHWDHIQGFPFFAPLFSERTTMRIWTTPALLPQLERALRAQMAPDVFPVPFEAVRAAVEFRAIAAEGTAVGELVVTTYPMRHPGGAAGFKVAPRDGGGGTLVYMPDNELYAGAPYETPTDWHSGLLDFLRDATVLVHDSMYTTTEYPAVCGWGHSTVSEAVQLATEAAVPGLLLFHHHPQRHDAAVDALVEDGRALAGELGVQLSVSAAEEGRRVRV